MMCTSHSVMEGQRHNNPLTRVAFVYNGPKGMDTSGHKHKQMMQCVRMDGQTDGAYHYTPLLLTDGKKKLISSTSPEYCRIPQSRLLINRLGFLLLYCVFFSTLMLMVSRQKGHLACKNSSTTIAKGSPFETSIGPSLNGNILPKNRSIKKAV